MGSAKSIRVAPISSQDARKIIRGIHYSGKVVSNSQLHFGVFMDGKCGGAMQFGPSLDKRKMQGIVEDTGWNGFLELNRMAFADWLPRNSESRAISYALRFIKKRYPHIKWVVSFADGTQCGDGTIYRACGFILTAIKENKDLIRLPSGEVLHKITLVTSGSRPRPELDGKSFFDITGGRQVLNPYAEYTGGEILKGHHLRYIKFLDPEYRKKLKVPEIPYSEIDRRGIRMYRGVRITSAGSIDGDASGFQLGEGGSIPTPALSDLSEVE